MYLSKSAMPAKEAKPMELSPALPSSAQLAELPLNPIAPAQVWTSLSLSQQNSLLQTVVRICREALLPAPVTLEAGHE
jgi:hypothetical protein